jgi:ketosteroid isomerase-like protein
MATGDVTTVRRLFEAHERGDGAAFLQLCHPEVEYRGRTSDERVFRGREGMSEWLRQLRAADVEIDAVPQDFDDRGDHVVVIGRLRIWDDGALKDAEATWCFELEDGLVTKIVPVDEERRAA